MRSDGLQAHDGHQAVTTLLQKQSSVQCALGIWTFWRQECFENKDASSTRAQHACAHQTVAHPLSVFLLEFIQSVIEHLSPLALVLLPRNIVSRLHFARALPIVTTRPFLLELLGSRTLCLLHPHVIL